MAARIAVQIRDGITPGLDSLSSGLRDKRPLLEAMGTQLASLTRRAFNEPQLRPAPWPVKWDGSPATLRKSQVLVRSIAITSVTGNSVTVSTDRIYGAIHQFGGEIRAKGKALRFQLGGKTIFAKKVKIPARPFFPFINGQITPSALAKIHQVGIDKLRSLANGGG